MPMTRHPKTRFSRDSNQQIGLRASRIMLTAILRKMLPLHGSLVPEEKRPKSICACIGACATCAVFKSRSIPASLEAGLQESVLPHYTLSKRWCVELSSSQTLKATRRRTALADRRLIRVFSTPPTVACLKVLDIQAFCRHAPLVELSYVVEAIGDSCLSRLSRL